MEVKSTGSMSVNELFSKVQSTRIQQGNPQGSGMTEEQSKRAVEEKGNQGRLWDEKELSSQIDAMNKLVDMKFTSLEFEQHEKLERTIVRVIDRDTEEVIKEIPPEEFLDMISSMLEFAGIIIDEKI